jgi:hypothetical protein
MKRTLVSLTRSHGVWRAEVDRKPWFRPAVREVWFATFGASTSFYRQGDGRSVDDEGYDACLLLLRGVADALQREQADSLSRKWAIGEAS